MFALSVIIFDIFSVNMHVLTCRVKSNYANQKPKYDFISDCNSNVCLNRHHLRDICCRNLHDLDVDL